jgi:hypothetical protein
LTLLFLIHILLALMFYLLVTQSESFFTSLYCLVCQLRCSFHDFLVSQFL